MGRPLRFILLPMGSWGDVLPFVALANQIKARGHQVLLVTNPAFRELAERWDLPFRALGREQDYQELKDDPALWHPLKAFPMLVQKGILPSLEPVLEILKQEKGGSDFVMVASTLCLGARAAREILNIPLATVHLQPAVFHSALHPPKWPGLPLPRRSPLFFRRLVMRSAEALLVDPLLRPGLNRFLRAHGEAPVRRVMSRWGNSPDLVLGFFPPWYASPQMDWPAHTRLVGFPLFDEGQRRELDGGLRAFLDSGAPPVAFTAGSAMKWGRDFYQRALSLCGELGCRGLLVSADPGQLPKALPRTVKAVSFAPFSRLLPLCRALVHHGGIGTLSQALKAGIPQGIVPFAHDQPDNAARIQGLGLGLGIPQRKWQGPKGLEALGSLIHDEKRRKRCADISQRLSREKPLEGACQALEELAA